MVSWEWLQLGVVGTKPKAQDTNVIVHHGALSGTVKHWFLNTAAGPQNLGVPISRAKPPSVAAGFAANWSYDPGDDVCHGLPDAAWLQPSLQLSHSFAVST